MKRILAAFLVVLIFTFPAWGIELVRQRSANTIVVFPLIDDTDNVSLLPSASPACFYAGWTDSAAPTGFTLLAAEYVELGSGFYSYEIGSTELNYDYSLIHCVAEGALDQSILIRTMTGDPLEVMTTTEDVLTLGQLRINASAPGGAVDIDNEGGPAISAVGDIGFSAIGAAGPGISALGSQDGIYAEGTGDDYFGLRGFGSGTSGSGGAKFHADSAGSGMNLHSAGEYNALEAIGDGSEPAFHLEGGSGGDAPALRLVGNSGGPGLDIIGDGDGIKVTAAWTGISISASDGYGVDASGTDGGINGVPVPTAAAVADAVWDELVADHQGGGSTGESLGVAGTAGDPWLTDLPGAYTGSDAGYIVGALLARDATLLGKLSPGVLQAAITAKPGTPLEIRRGDVTTLTFSLARNLTGKKVYFTAKANPSDDNADAVISGLCTITDAVNGVATYTTSTTETATEGDYYYDVEIREADDTAPSTAIYGRVRILTDVRQ